VEARGHVLIAHLDGGPHGLMGLNMAKALAALVDKVESDENVRAVVLTALLLATRQRRVRWS
jgi:enoyl-CoA hydratase